MLLYERVILKYFQTASIRKACFQLSKKVALCFWRTYIITLNVIIISSCLTSLDSSKPIEKKFSVNHEVLKHSCNIVAGMKMHMRKEVKVKSSMARSLPVENLLPQNAGSIINYLQ